MVKQLTVAAIQMEASFAQREQNLAKAEGYLQQAALQGAELILLPELLPYGYGINEAVWLGAEPLNGPSVQWLCQQAKQHAAYIGFTFLETDGEDFYNTFVLANPGGGIAGQVRKSPAPAVESYFYRAGTGSHVIETELGRIGISICYEVLLHERLQDLYDSDIDLCLQPAAAGRAKPFIPGDVARMERSFLHTRTVYHQTLGVPIILANRVGKLEGRLPGVMGTINSSFMGGSYIADHNGNILCDMDTHNEEGVIVAQITLHHGPKQRHPPKRFGKMWAVPMPWFGFIFPMAQRWGENAYSKSERRRQRAHQQFT